MLGLLDIIDFVQRVTLDMSKWLAFAKWTRYCL